MGKDRLPNHQFFRGELLNFGGGGGVYSRIRIDEQFQPVMQLGWLKSL